LADDFPGYAEHRGGITFSSGGKQGLSDTRCVGAVLRSEAGISRGHREAVAFADRGVGDDLRPQVEIPHHAADHGELLEIFFTEDGGVAGGEEEKF